MDNFGISWDKSGGMLEVCGKKGHVIAFLSKIIDNAGK